MLPAAKGINQSEYQEYQKNEIFCKDSMFRERKFNVKVDGEMKMLLLPPLQSEFLKKGKTETKAAKISFLPSGFVVST